MNKENIPVITDREKLYDKCKNMEQLFDKYYLPLLDKHYSKVYQLQQENQKLKKQLEYIRSGEYLNQLKFERNMLEDVVSNGEVSKEDKEFIDMTHRNTELLEQNQKYKEVIFKIKMIISARIKEYQKKIDNEIDMIVELKV